ncbi:MAG: prolyl oligopeptidase family serine peptidase [Endomicrobiia bacterium]|nr:prolyl oligopeptidase family serine peptidase [Endomicrobiia bacterium]
MKLHPVVFWAIVLSVAVAIWGWFSSNLILKAARARDIVTPDNLRAPSENISFYSGKRKLAGWFVPSSDKESGSTIIICHGWGASKGDILVSTIFLREKHNLFYFDFTAHGESEGSRISMGKFESEDILSAVRFLEKTKPASAEKIGVWGFSLGASAAIVAAALDGRIAAVAAESPFYSFNEITSHYAKRFLKAPEYPFVPLARAAARLRFGFDPEKYSPSLFVAEISPRPLLFIASSGDENIPPAVTKKLFDAAGEPKRFVIFESRAHGAAASEHPEEYRKLLADFFAESLKALPPLMRATKSGTSKQ